MVQPPCENSVVVLQKVNNHNKEVNRELPYVLVWAAISNGYRPSGLNNRHLFLTVLEAEKSEIQGVSRAKFW